MTGNLSLIRQVAGASSSNVVLCAGRYSYVAFSKRADHDSPNFSPVNPSASPGSLCESEDCLSSYRFAQEIDSKLIKLFIQLRFLKSWLCDISRSSPLRARSLLIAVAFEKR